MTCKETHASCLRYDAELGCLVYDNNLGESKPVKLPAPMFSAILNSQCELVIFANNEPVTNVDLTPLLAKIQGSDADLDFRPGPCQLIWTPPDGGAPQTFDLSAILDKAQDGASYNQTTCVLTITNVNGEEESFSLANILGKSQDAINFNPTDCVLTYTNVNGDPAEVQLTALFNKMQFNGQTCELTVPTPAGVRVFDMSQVLTKISVAYDPNTHSLVVNNNGNITSQVINCSSLELIQNGNTCTLRFTNAKGQVNNMALPGSSFTRDAATCTITVGDGKGGGFTFREGLDPVSDIQFSLTVDKDLQLQVKDECMKITLPDFVTDVTISDDNCELKVFKWCGETQTIDIFAALGLTKNDDGGFNVRLKDQLCTFSPATLVVNPDNPNEFIFNNQFGQTTVITVPSVALDMDGATLNGSVLQLTFGGDGNPGSLNVDICSIVAQNCNATLTVNEDGSLTHVDNAGKATNVPAPQSAEFKDTCDQTIDPDTALLHTAQRGSLVLALGRGANGNNDNVFHPSCVPPEPACTDVYQWTSRDGIIWQWDVGQQGWRAIMSTSCLKVHDEDAAVNAFPTNSSQAGAMANIAPTGPLDDAELQALFDTYGTGQAIPMAIHETCIPSEACMQRIVYGGHYRSNPTSELSSQINLNVITEISSDGGNAWTAAAVWGGSTGKTMGMRACILEAVSTIDPGCNFVIMNDDYNLDQHSQAGYNLNPQNDDFCVRTYMTLTFAEDYVSRPDNRLTPGSQQLTFFSQRNTGVICESQVLDGFQFD